MIKPHLLCNALIHTDSRTDFPQHANADQLLPPLRHLASCIILYIFIYSYIFAIIL